MKKMTTIAAVLAVLVMATSAMAQGSYSWSVSASSTDPGANTGSVAGFGTTYLWFECSDTNNAAIAGMSAAEFDAVASAPYNLAAFTPMSGFLNAGGATNLLLAVGACPPGPVLAGSWVTVGSGPGTICLMPSAANGLNVTVNCEGTPTAFENNWNGLNLDGGGDCSMGGRCVFGPVSVEESSWGAVKSLYQ